MPLIALWDIFIYNVSQIYVGRWKRRWGYIVGGV